MAAEEVLDGAREDVVNAGATVRRGRSLVEHERRGTGARSLCLLEQLLGVPAREQLLLEGVGARVGEQWIRNGFLRCGHESG